MNRIGTLCVAGLLAALCAISGIALAAPATPSTDTTERVFIEYSPHHAGMVQQAIEHSRGVIHYRFDNLHTFSASLPGKAVDALRKRADVVLIETDPKRYPMSQTIPYGVSLVQAPLVWAGSGGGTPITGAGVEVCVIDSGIDAKHEDLLGIDISGDITTDGCGHGTHVAGTIAAADNSLGVEGVSPGVSLYSVKVFGGPDCAWTYSSTLIDAANRCVAHGSDIISMSLGGTMKSRTEDRAFQNYYDNDNMLSVAAAGNDGNTRKSYPASYDSVISVAAIDASKNVASFSQQNDQVELAAPGVGVLSTVPMGTGTSASVTNTSGAYEADAMDGSPLGTASATMVDCGLGDTVCTGATGQICLIQRGTVTFADKVSNCEAGGGIAAIIYNNVSGALLGTLGSTATSIPAVGVSDVDGAALLGQLGDPTTVAVSPSNYATWDGTSMATPHVSGVAALLWSAHPLATNAEIRDAMQQTAEDLGPAGRDNAYGYGLVRAENAMAYLGTPTSVNQPPVAAFTFDCSSTASSTGSCSFTNTSSDPDNDPLTYQWSFGDGSGSSATDPTHIYSCSKGYTVTLTVTDDKGASASNSQTVTPSGDACATAQTLTISNVNASKLKGVKFEITWTTNEAADSTVTFDCCGTHSDSAMVTDHRMTFNGSKGATYTYSVTSTDAAGETVTDGPHTFRN